MGAGRRCPLRFSGEAPQDVDRARFVALGLAAAALLVINRVVALIVGLVRADRNRCRSRNVEPPDASPTGLVSSSRSRLRTHLDVAQRSNCPSKIKNQFGYHAQDRRARREGRRRNEVPIDSGAPPSALQPATTRRSNSVGRWPRSGAGAEAENTRSCQGAGRFWNEDRLPPAEPGR